MKANVELIKFLDSDAFVAYIADEMSFDTFPSLNSIFSLSVKYIQLGFNDNMFLENVWGFCPKSAWKNVHMKPPLLTPGRIRVEGDFVPGVSYPLYEPNSILYDEDSNWLCIGEHDVLDERYMNILIMRNAGLTLFNNEIISLWINPKYMDTND